MPEPATLRLTSNHILDLLGDENFYVKVIAYFFMRDQGLASVKKYKELVVNKDGEGCRSCSGKENENTVMTPAVHSFTNLTLALHRQDTSLLDPLKAFIRAKLNYPIKEVQVYYKSDNKVQSVVF